MWIVRDRTRGTNINGHRRCPVLKLILFFSMTSSVEQTDPAAFLMMMLGGGGNGNGDFYDGDEIDAEVAARVRGARRAGSAGSRGGLSVTTAQGPMTMAVEEAKKSLDLLVRVAEQNMQKVCLVFRFFSHMCTFPSV